MWVFFFKQKTAYEMRISDWSSDVCSSDLPVARDHDLRRIIVVGDGADFALGRGVCELLRGVDVGAEQRRHRADADGEDRKSTRLNSSHYCAARMPSSA